MDTLTYNSIDINATVYKIRDVAVRINRNKRTIIRWELSGKIPPAKRNNTGERTYTENDIKNISKLHTQKDFYQRRPKR